MLDRAAIQPEMKRFRCHYLNGKSSAIAVQLKYGFLNRTNRRQQNACYVCFLGHLLLVICHKNL
ncbi:hypothetical protein [Gloeocapsopsis sp. IPPAS B-1203]|uniref:hypothetical protein n=1 Tax=Gloeocapsopsis sp. IPPAS B-1203 TaxID=2049454 RepID=UPI0025A1BCBB|nr:hypothetical protein [Gloeocapsopsis sp. IPPAS B-1203]